METVDSERFYANAKFNITNERLGVIEELPITDEQKGIDKGLKMACEILDEEYEKHKANGTEEEAGRAASDLMRLVNRITEEKEGQEITKKIKPKHYLLMIFMMIPACFGGAVLGAPIWIIPIFLAISFFALYKLISYE